MRGDAQSCTQCHTHPFLSRWALKKQFVDQLNYRMSSWDPCQRALCEQLLWEWRCPCSTCASCAVSQFPCIYNSIVNSNSFWKIYIFILFHCISLMLFLGIYKHVHFLKYSWFFNELYCSAILNAKCIWNIWLLSARIIISFLLVIYFNS